jgi:hypothetical protein
MVKFTDINFNNIKSLLKNDENTDIPITEYLLLDFNNRSFHSGNINKIISLCELLLIQNIEHFIIINMEPSIDEYILETKYKEKYKIPYKKYKNMRLENMATHGLLKYLKFAHMNKRPFTPLTCLYASVNGHLDCLKYLMNNGCPWHKNTCEQASKHGHLDCLMWAKNNGCSWNIHTCELASANGHLDCLMWARENGCHWTSDACRLSLKYGHLDCLKYLRDNGCPN